MKITGKHWYVELLSALLAGLFTYAALSKLLKPAAFEAMLNYWAFSSNYISLFVWLFTAIEFAIALSIMVPATRSIGLKICCGYLLMITAVICSLLIFSTHLPCSCAGIFSALSWMQQLWLNISLILACAFALLLSRKLKPHCNTLTDVSAGTSVTGEY